jgi:hypothetical protein
MSSRIIPDLVSHWWNLVYGIRNVWRWLPIIWRDRDWDWEYIAKVLEFKLRKHAELEETCGHHVGSELDAKRMRICIALLRRLREDEYFENAQRRFRNARQAGDFAHLHQRADQRYLGLILGKYLTHWWD